MPDFGFVGASYEAPSIYQDAQECINFRPEIDPTLPEGDRNVIALYPTPGLTLIAQLYNQDEVRGLRALSGGEQMLAVCGSLVFALDINYNTNWVIGQLQSGQGAINVVDNGLYAYITDGNNRYTWKINRAAHTSFLGTVSGSTLTVTQVLDGMITIGMVLNGLNVPVDTIITAGSGTTWTLSRTVALTEETRFFGSSPASVFNNSYISGNRLFVGTNTDFVSGEIFLGQRLYTSGITPNTIITATFNEDQALTGEGKSGTYTVNNPNPQGTVTSATVANAGTGYTSLPTINIDAPLNPLGEQAIVICNSLKVGMYTLPTNPTGTGYAVGNALVGIGGTYTSPVTFTVASVDGSGGITGLNLIVAGSYSAVPTNPVRLYGGAGTGAMVNLNFGLNNDFTVQNAGSGYVQTPITATVTGGSGAGGTVAIQQGASPTPVSFRGYDFTVMPANDGAFSTGVGLSIMDNLFIYAEPQAQRFACTGPLSPITDGLSFGLKDGSPDDIVATWANNRQLFVLGERSSEVWIDAGSVPFAFQRLPSASTQQGCAAPYSIARLGSTIAYVSRNSRGEGQVVVLEGYVATRISTHAVEASIQNQNIEDARAYTYQLEGHEVYVVSFPSIDITWCYDVTTQLWHKWMRWDNGTQTFRRFRGEFATQFRGRVIVGDFENGKLYYLDSNNYTYDGEPVHRLRRAPHIVVDYKQEYHSALQLYFQPGVGVQGVGNNSLMREPRAMLRWSNDGGSTYSNEYWQSVGSIGEYRNRAIWRRLGRARDRVYELRVSDPVKWVIVSAELVIDVGAH